MKKFSEGIGSLNGLPFMACDLLDMTPIEKHLLLFFVLFENWTIDTHHFHCMESCRLQRASAARLQEIVDWKAGEELMVTAMCSD